MTDPLPLTTTLPRRERILDAAEAVFATKGFHSTTIRDVARAASVADGTIYNDFANKHDLLLGIYARMRAAIAQSPPSTPPDGDPRTVLAAILRHPLDALRGNRAALFRVVASEMLVSAELQTRYAAEILQPTIAAAEQLLTAWAAQRLVRPTDPPLTARVVTGVILGLLLARAVGDGPLNDDTTWDDLPTFLADLLLNGLQGDAR